MASASQAPLLLVPYMWIGDFVRCHTVISVAQMRWPGRPIDVLSSSLCAPLVDYMPGVRRAIVSDLPHGRLALREQWRLSQGLRAEGYEAALVVPRKWKAALAPFLAGIPKRVGMVGEARFGLINDLRWNEKALPRMVDRCATLALPRDTAFPKTWPPPRLCVGTKETADWRRQYGISDIRAVALCPGAAGAQKRWPPEAYANLARQLKAANVDLWIVGGPDERAAAEQISDNGRIARDQTGGDLRAAIRALATATVAVANDSGLLHVAAALGTPTIGLYGMTAPAVWAPLNPLAAVIEAPWSVPCPKCGRSHCTDVRHRRTSDISVDKVFAAVVNALAAGNDS